MENKYYYQNILNFLTNMIEKNNEKNKLTWELQKIRNYKKNHYWMHSGKVKLSTIHSFKGWEIDTLFLVIAPGSHLEGLDELIYTALTRCRHNLFILDCDKSRYASFFQAVLNSPVPSVMGF